MSESAARGFLTRTGVGVDVGSRLEHHSHARIDRRESFHRLVLQIAGITMRKQPLVERDLAGVAKVLVNGVVSPLVQLRVNLGVSVVRLISERKQCLSTAGVRALSKHFAYIIERYQRCFTRRVEERAVGAGVPTRRGQRDEDVARKREPGRGSDVTGTDGTQSVDLARRDVELAKCVTSTALLHSRREDPDDQKAITQRGVTRYPGKGRWGHRAGSGIPQPTSLARTGKGVRAVPTRARLF